MTKPAVYKVCLPYRWPDGDHSCGMEAFLALWEQAVAYLEEIGNSATFVNAYGNQNEHECQGRLVVVLDDPDAAMMLKLASA